MSDAFQSLGLRPELIQAVSERGYENPTPIQSAAIPHLLDGRDVIGQAQTGTGKTAAFALPLLQNLDTTAGGVQALILTPTRELAIQNAQAIYGYGHHRGVRVLPVYGGQSYDRQVRRLERDTHIVVGTPGRTLDLIRRGALDLTGVRYVVLDEADEMLKMGFIEDVEAILTATPAERQTSLFSATLSSRIRSLAAQYLVDPLEVTIESATLTVEETEQRYYVVDKDSKLAALARLLEVELYESVLVFTRTRMRAAELVESLMARGFMVEAVHGDLNQDAREMAVRRFRTGITRIMVATDVVARGVDIPHVSHVVNYDMPYDPEDYVHRIGRTGRAGRSGVAITLVVPGEMRRLRAIEDFTHQRITRAALPGEDAVYARRDARFIEGIGDLMDTDELAAERALLEELTALGMDLHDIAAAAIRLARADEALRPVDPVKEIRGAIRDRPDHPKAYKGKNPRRPRTGQEPGMVRLHLNLGRNQGVRPRDVVGTLAGETGISGKAIGAIDIQQDYTYVDVKTNLADTVVQRMKKGRMCGRPVTLVRA